MALKFSSACAGYCLVMVDIHIQKEQCQCTLGLVQLFCLVYLNGLSDGLARQFADDTSYCNLWNVKMTSTLKIFSCKFGEAQRPSQNFTHEPCHFMSQSIQKVYFYLCIYANATNIHHTIEQINVNFSITCPVELIGKYLLYFSDASSQANAIGV